MSCVELGGWLDFFNRLVGSSDVGGGGMGGSSWVSSVMAKPGCDS